MFSVENASSDEQAIRTLIDNWAAAVRRRDTPAILRAHSPDLLMFDLPPPMQSVGLAAYEETWNLFFSWPRETVAFDISEMNITAGTDVAFVTALMHCSEPDADGNAIDLDFRLTIGLRKIAGAWTITHEHHSIPAEIL